MASKEDRNFPAAVRFLGPQWLLIDGIQYQCFTSIRGDYIWYIAKAPHDYRLYRVDSFTPTAEAVPITNPPSGEVLSPQRQVSLDFILQTIAEAKLFKRDGLSLEDYAKYIVMVWIPAQLIHPDDLTRALMRSLPETEINDLFMFQGDAGDSPRLRNAWVVGLTALAKKLIKEYEAAQ